MLVDHSLLLILSTLNIPHNQNSHKEHSSPLWLFILAGTDKKMSHRHACYPARQNNSLALAFPKKVPSLLNFAENTSVFSSSQNPRRYGHFFGLEPSALENCPVLT